MPRGTVTFLFTDIEGSTALVRELRSEFGRVRSDHRRLLREAFARHGGYEIDTAGDGFFVAFEQAGDAVAAAAEAQRALQAQSDAPVRVRIGVHTAEPYLDESGYTGVGVHRASRICDAGHGGQILVSNATAGIVEDLDLDGVQLVDLGEHSLKGMARPQRLFQLVVEGLPSEFPPLETLDSDRSRPSIVTLVIADLAGWDQVLRVLGDEAAAAAARAYHALVVKTVRAENGRELEVAADTVLAAFDRPRDAVRAALRIREALQSEPWFTHGDAPGVSIAINSGPIVDPSARHLGTVAVRGFALCKLANPGQILVSHATEALLAGEGSSLTLRDLGERSLRSLDQPAHVYEVIA
jgi:class 3 adenylate cyclase